MDFVFRAAERFLHKHKNLTRYRRIFAVLAAVVVFATTYELILPAITMDRRRAAETPGVEVGVAAQAQENDSDGETFEETSGEALREAGADTESSREYYEEEIQEDTQKDTYENENNQEPGSDHNNIENTQSPGNHISNSNEENSDNAENKQDIQKAADTSNSSNVSGTDADDDGSDGRNPGLQQDVGADDSGTENIRDNPVPLGLPQDTALDGTDSTADVTDPAALTFEGEDYTVTATFDETAALPADTRLYVTEILPETVYRDEDEAVLYADYDEYYERTLQTLEKEKRLEDRSVSSARFFDIVFANAENNIVEPAAPVTVAVQYKDALSAEDTIDTMAVHFDDVPLEEREDEDVPEIGRAKVIETLEKVREKEIEEISFTSDMLSVCAIVATTDEKEVILTEKSAGEMIAITPSEYELSNSENSGMTATVKETGQGGGSGSLLDLSTYLKTSGVANDWQTVDRQYAGNEKTNKVSFDSADDGDKPDVYLQKDVVGTGTENEFYVYVSVDKPMSLGELFEGARFAISTDKNREVGDVYDGLQGEPDAMLYDEPAGEFTIPHLVTINVYDSLTLTKHGNTYTEEVGTLLYSYQTLKYGKDTPQCSNGSAYVEIPYSGDRLSNAHKYPSDASHGWLTLSTGTNLKANPSHGSGGALVFDMGIRGNAFLERYTTTFTSLDTVTDEMGDNIVFLGVEECDGSYEYEDGVLIWNPADNMKVKAVQEVDADSDNWYRNVAQMVYRVRLDVQGEKSCADTIDSKPDTSSDDDTYPVNKQAVLNYRQAKSASTTDNGYTYTLQNDTEYEAEFPVPSVRGLLYDVGIEKANISNFSEKLAGAEFRIYSDQDCKNELAVGTTGKQGVLKFSNLPYGTYYLKETKAPDGFTATDEVFTAVLSYTTNKALLKQDSDDLAGNMLYTASNEDSGKYVTNDESRFAIALYKVDGAGNALNGAEFSLASASGQTKSGSEFVFSGTTGINENNNETGYIYWDGVPAGTYTLTETRVPSQEYKKLFKEAIVTVTPQGEVEIKPDDVVDDSGESVANVVTVAGDKTIETQDDKKSYGVIKVVNSKNTVRAAIRKTDANGYMEDAGGVTTYLAGAEFTITNNDPGKTAVSNAELRKSGQDGCVTADDGIELESGKSYLLTETAAPEGYNRIDGTILIEVPETGTNRVIARHNVENGTQYNVRYDENKDVYIIYIPNTPGAVLPETGGTGILSPLTLCTIMAVAFALATAVLYNYSMERD